MNKNRWTSLTTALLAVIAPAATVSAQTLPSAPAVSEPSSSIPLSPQSLPIVTPLNVTELQTETAVPASGRSVPQVSKLPSIKSIGRTTATSKSQPSAPTVAGRNPFNPLLPSISSVTPLPQISTPAVNSFDTATAKAPTIVVRNEHLPATTGVNATAVNIPSIPSTQTTIVATTSDRTIAPATPTTTEPSGTANTPHPEAARERAEVPSFEAGLPVYIFENERPQQIVATAIAQVDGQIAAPEPSIAIPVDRPKQSTIPGATTAPAPDVKTTPVDSSIVPTVPAIPTATAPGSGKIDRSTDTVPAAIDKVISTYTGKASWYGSEAGSRTASGERYNPNGLSAAHRTLPFGTNVRVTNLKTGKAVTVRINDRGPFRRGRIIDLSAAAADAIEMKASGIGDVKVEVLGIQGYALMLAEE